MDLRMYARVIWRFRLIVGAGLVLACVLAFLSFAKVSLKGGSPSISYRQSETWKASAMMFITQRGFPWGRTVLPYTTQQAAGGGYPVTNYADSGRLSSLAAYYAQLANSDPVQRIVHSGAHRYHGTVLASVIVDPVYHYAQPFVRFDGLGQSPGAAVDLANRGTAAFQQFLEQQQAGAGIPVSQRVTPTVINRAYSAALSAGRRKTAPIVIFLTTLLAAIGLAFILENLRPRVQLVGRSEEDKDLRAATSQRTA